MGWASGFCLGAPAIGALLSPFLVEGSPTKNGLQEKGYPHSNLSTGVFCSWFYWFSGSATQQATGGGGKSIVGYPGEGGGRFKIEVPDIPPKKIDVGVPFGFPFKPQEGYPQKPETGARCSRAELQQGPMVVVAGIQSMEPQIVKLAFPGAGCEGMDAQIWPWVKIPYPQ